MAPPATPYGAAPTAWPPTSAAVVLSTDARPRMGVRWGTGSAPRRSGRSRDGRPGPGLRPPSAADSVVRHARTARSPFVEAVGKRGGAVRLCHIHQQDQVHCTNHQRRRPPVCAPPPGTSIRACAPSRPTSPTQGSGGKVGRRPHARLHLRPRQYNLRKRWCPPRVFPSRIVGSYRCGPGRGRGSVGR